MNLHRLTRGELDRLKRDARAHDPLYPLFDHIAAVEAENAELIKRRDFSLSMLDAGFSAIDEWWANGDQLNPQNDFQRGMAKITDIVWEFATTAADYLKYGTVTPPEPENLPLPPYEPVEQGGVE